MVRQMRVMKQYFLQAAGLSRILQKVPGMTVISLPVSPNCITFAVPWLTGFQLMFHHFHFLKIFTFFHYFCDEFAGHLADGYAVE